MCARDRARDQSALLPARTSLLHMRGGKLVDEGSMFSCNENTYSISVEIVRVCAAHVMTTTMTMGRQRRTEPSSQPRWKLKAAYQVHLGLLNITSLPTKLNQNQSPVDICLACGGEDAAAPFEGPGGVPSNLKRSGRAKLSRCSFSRIFRSLEALMHKSSKRAPLSDYQT